MTAPDLDLEALREIVANGTPLPWFVDDSGDGHLFVGNRADGRNHGLWEIVYMTAERMDELKPEAQARDRADAALIVAAVNALPVLLDIAEQVDAAEEWSRSAHEDSKRFKEHRDALTADRDRQHERAERWKAEAYKHAAAANYAEAEVARLTEELGQYRKAEAEETGRA